MRQLTVVTREHVRNLLLEALSHNPVVDDIEEGELLTLASRAELKLLRASRTKSGMLQKAARAVQDLKRLPTPFQLDWLGDDGSVRAPALETDPASESKHDTPNGDGSSFVSEYSTPSHSKDTADEHRDEAVVSSVKTPYKAPPAVTMFFEHTDFVAKAAPAHEPSPVDPVEQQDSVEPADMTDLLQAAFGATESLEPASKVVERGDDMAAYKKDVAAVSGAQAMVAQPH